MAEPVNAAVWAPGSLDTPASAEQCEAAADGQCECRRLRNAVGMQGHRPVVDPGGHGEGSFGIAAPKPEGDWAAGGREVRESGTRFTVEVLEGALVQVVEGSVGPGGSNSSETLGEHLAALDYCRPSAESAGAVEEDGILGVIDGKDSALRRRIVDGAVLEVISPHDSIHAVGDLAKSVGISAGENLRCRSGSHSPDDHRPVGGVEGALGEGEGVGVCCTRDEECEKESSLPHSASVGTGLTPFVHGQDSIVELACGQALRS